MPDFSSDMSRYGWALVARGIVAILFGIVAFAMPGITLASLAFLFAVFVVASAVLAVGSGVSRIVSGAGGWTAFLVGALGLLVGLRMFAYPGVTVLAVLWIVGIWAIASGVAEFVAGIRLRREITDEWRLILSGLLSCLFGVLLIWFPVLGGLAVAWSIGAAAIAYGVAEIVLGLRLRKIAQPVGRVYRDEDRRAA
jgi:uncharacterized membrane protein HdeD (DUF308 family)